MAYTVEKSDRRFEIVEKNTGLVVSVHKKERPALRSAGRSTWGPDLRGSRPPSLL
jgi:hypothetical protein